eukprot:9206597-Prorocentrum_lima.AAC.1
MTGLPECPCQSSWNAWNDDQRSITPFGVHGSSTSSNPNTPQRKLGMKFAIAAGEPWERSIHIVNWVKEIQVAS